MCDSGDFRHSENSVMRFIMSCNRGYRHLSWSLDDGVELGLYVSVDEIQMGFSKVLGCW